MTLSKHNTEDDPGSTGAPGPLLSWDIFLSSYHKKMQLLGDAQLIYNFGKQQHWKHNWDFRKVLLEMHKVIIVTQTDLTIVCVSNNMFDMTGYTPGEIIGKTPRMFQGAETQPGQRQLIRNAIHAVQPFETTLINYTRAGQPYNCHIEGFPVFNTGQRLSHFIAFENAV